MRTGSWESFVGKRPENIEHNHFEHAISQEPKETKDVKSAIKSEVGCALLK